MNCVAEGFPDLLSDVFAKTDDVARCPHFYYLAIVRHSVKGGMNQLPPLAEECPNIVRNLNIGGVHAAVLQNDCVKLQINHYPIISSVFYLGCKGTNPPRVLMP